MPTHLPKQVSVTQLVVAGFIGAKKALQKNHFLNKKAKERKKQRNLVRLREKHIDNISNYSTVHCTTSL